MEIDTLKVDNLTATNQTVEDQTITDDLTVGDDLSVAWDLAVTGNSTLTGTLAVTWTSTLTGAVTATRGVQSSAVAVEATETWATTGIIPAGTTFASVTSGNVAHIVKLPTPVLWNILYIKEVGANGFEIMPQANTQYINGTLCDVAKSLAMAGNTGVAVFVCVVGGTAWKWVQYWIDDDGTIDSGGTPD